eukprot:gnl/MRDRNA2_/MRDRNA2_16034_c0_seq1.p1 gnl/MRDRNA2_/MRDRNA2_16034_c0~~gnl/MRDRNA2_/MRDRNA2_16034_c0_seq1.p1  ORF type:complete len:597 (+),score=63.13 gnl/MRDRNA2_/MRDRNA2_16034_c0_seq1:174-1964(+)
MNRRLSEDAIIEQEPGHMHDDVSEFYNNPFFPHAPRRPTVALPKSTIERHRRASLRRFATPIPMHLQTAGGPPRHGWSGLVTQIMTTDFPSPQESCRCVATFFLFLSVTFLAIVFLIKDRHQKTLQWAQRSWIEDKCLVVDTGVRYEGNCKNNSDAAASGQMKLMHPRPEYDYSVCDEAPLCEAALSKAYNFPEARRLTVANRFKRKRVQDVAPEPCYDLFVPWGMVSLPKEDNSTACGFRYGFGSASRYARYGEALQAHQLLQIKKEKGKRFTCWYTNLFKGEGHTGACNVVALEDPSKWLPTHSLRAFFEQWLRPSLWCAAGISFGISIVAAIVVFYLRHKDYDKWRPTRHSFFGTSQRLSEPDEGPSSVDAADERMNWLHSRWDLMRTQILAGYLPPPTEYLPLNTRRKSSMRKVEVAELADPQHRHSDRPENRKKSILVQRDTSHRDSTLDSAKSSMPTHDPNRSPKIASKSSSRVSFLQVDDSDVSDSENDESADQQRSVAESFVYLSIQRVAASLSSSTRSPPNCSSCGEIGRTPVTDRCYVHKDSHWQGTSAPSGEGSSSSQSTRIPFVEASERSSERSSGAAQASIRE